MDFINLPCYPIQHKRNIAASMASLVGNKLHSDVTFCLDGEYVAAHRLILAARSDVFEAMLYRHQQNVVEKTIHIDDITMKCFRQLLTYCYTDQIKLCHESVIGTLYAAHKYHLLFLEERCEQFIGDQNITCENVLGYINELYPVGAFESLKIKLFQFVCDNFYDKFESVDCLLPIESVDLLKHLLEKLVVLEHKPDRGLFEYQLFGMLVQWAKHKANGNGDIRSQLAGAEELIRFENLNAELMNKCLAEHYDFFNDAEIKMFATRQNRQSTQQYQRSNQESTEGTIKFQLQEDGSLVMQGDPKLFQKQLRAITAAPEFDLEE